MFPQTEAKEIQLVENRSTSAQTRPVFSTKKSSPKFEATNSQHFERIYSSDSTVISEVMGKKSKDIIFSQNNPVQGVWRGKTGKDSTSSQKEEKTMKNGKVFIFYKTNKTIRDRCNRVLEKGGAGAGEEERGSRSGIYDQRKLQFTVRGPRVRGK